MILYVTVGTTDGPIEKEFEIPEGKFVTFLGMEIEHTDEETKLSNRMTITRQSFVEPFDSSYYEPIRSVWIYVTREDGPNGGIFAKEEDAIAERDKWAERGYVFGYVEEWPLNVPK